jgi:Domain of unknown function (DUF4062)
MHKRKMQVFVSSTYMDLKHERQAAVEAILDAGHIPAGMELFAADNNSQWVQIQEWIEESDIFMLILGGRYGSIEPSGEKSYIHLEYEFADSIGKPLFALVIKEEALKERLRTVGESVWENDNYPKLQEFRKLVKLQSHLIM